jgi:hypothetical protein
VTLTRLTDFERRCSSGVFPSEAAGERTSVSSLDCHLARLFLEPLLRTGSAMRTARPTTGSAFARLKFLHRALNSVIARCFLLGRDDPTNPFVPRQRRQILPCRLRGPFRAQRHAQVHRGFVHGTGLARFAFVHHFTSGLISSQFPDSHKRTRAPVWWHRFDSRSREARAVGMCAL